MAKKTPMTGDLFVHTKSRAKLARDRVGNPEGTARPGRRESRRLQAAAEQVTDEIERRIRRTIEHRSFETHFQPIIDLRTGDPLGTEALSRFSDEPVRAPDVWFAEAASVGLGYELEIVAVEKALAQLNRLPSAMYLSINASAETIRSERFQAYLDGVQTERVVIEVTEHTPITDYVQFATSIADLRSRGVRLAVDDAGAGYAGFGHLLDLKPDIVKLDIALTRGIDRDPARQALGRALLRFGLETYRTTMVAEGIETREELATLQSLGCRVGQGFALGRPSLLINRPPLHLLEFPKGTSGPTDHRSVRPHGASSAPASAPAPAPAPTSAPAPASGSAYDVTMPGPGETRTTEPGQPREPGDPCEPGQPEDEATLLSAS
jgi:EAL domain-containing protein (putative c-di-GMP-specific phosphodiesterase class I)